MFAWCPSRSKRRKVQPPGPVHEVRCPRAARRADGSGYTARSSRGGVMRFMQMASLALVCTSPLLVQAQAFPTKPIRIVVPFSAGGPADITARTVAPRLTELLGQQIIVDNRAGANGTIGADAVVRAAPDGYTLLLATASVSSINMVTYAKPPYNTLRDLQPLTTVMTTSSLIVIHPSIPAKTLKELVA
ncbi:MAG: tripartite tricarboxylate transporter substrate binding protein, partial [Betaproteobacteria bacterium]